MGKPDRKVNIVAKTHLDPLRQNRDVFPAFLGQILKSIVTDGFDKQVLGIGISGRESPSDMTVVTENVIRNARHRNPGQPQGRRLDPCHVPEVRCSESEMGIVGQDRLAAVRPLTRQDPGI